MTVNNHKIKFGRWSKPKASGASLNKTSSEYIAAHQIRPKWVKYPTSGEEISMFEAYHIFCSISYHAQLEVFYAVRREVRGIFVEDEV